jgi:hypothetical protein
MPDRDLLTSMEIRNDEAATLWGNIAVELAS